MIEYDCGCTSKGLLILEWTPTILIAVEEWDETDKTQCFHCWYKTRNSVIDEAKETLQKLEAMKEPDGSIIIEKDGVKYRIVT